MSLTFSVATFKVISVSLYAHVSPPRPCHETLQDISGVESSCSRSDISILLWTASSDSKWNSSKGIWLLRKNCQTASNKDLTVDVSTLGFIYWLFVISWSKILCAKEHYIMLRIFERRLLRRIYDPLRKMVYGDQGVTMNCINYVMNQI
jgi:hypothetical protein